MPRIPYRYRDVAQTKAVDAVASKFRFEDRTSVQDIFGFLTMPSKVAGEEALPLLFNNLGPSLVRRVFGPARFENVGSKRVVFDPSHVAEALIYFAYGRIPVFMEVIRALRSPLGIKQAASLEEDRGYKSSQRAVGESDQAVFA
jgi:hypothetical protein